MKRLSLYIVALFSIGLSAAAQDFRGQFNELLSAGYMDQAKTTLDQWAHQAPDDPELYPARFNYLINTSRELALSLDSIPGDFELPDSLQQYNPLQLYESYVWNDTVFNRGIQEIEQGIAAHPDRLDFRLGEASAFRYREMPDSVANLLIRLLEYEHVSKPEWLWTGGEPVGEDSAEGSQIVRECVQDYLVWMNEIEAYQPAAKIAEVLLKFNPDDAMAINVLGGAYTANGDYSSALDAFQKALALMPNDPIVLLNIAYLYYVTDQKPHALEIYRAIRDDDSMDEYYRDWSGHAFDQLMNEIERESHLESPDQNRIEDAE